MSMRTKDSRQRGAALTRIASTMLVEAGAGTGKTSIMAGRIVRLLASGVEPSRIAAVTFTELAASELQDRVRRFAAVVATGGKLPPDIAGAFPGGVSAEEASSVATALSSLQEMTFGTIHSFCQRLLQPYPVEARMDPGARVLDATEASLLFTDTFEAWLRERLDVEDTGDDVVAHYAVALGRAAESDLEEIARAIYANPSASDSGVSLDRRLATRFVEAVDSYALWSKGLGFGHEDHDVYVARLVLLADRVRDLMRTGEAEACVGIASLVTPLMTSSGTFRKMKMKGKWVAAGGKEAGTAADEAAVARYTECAGLFGAMLDNAAEAGGALLVRALRPMVESYERRKVDKSAVDFDDLVVKALNLLRSHPEVADHLGRNRFTHILVDEFQDTDPVQSEIFTRLTFDGCTTEGTERAVPRPGALFLVGDPKQAIYRFRGADIAAYTAMKDRLKGAKGSETVEVTTNFRSRNGVTEYVNGVFREPLSAPSQPGFAPLSSFRDDGDGLPSVHALWTGASAARTAEEKRKAEAEAVARLCRDAIGHLDVWDKGGLRKCRPSDIALLAPAGTELHHYDMALENEGVSVATQAGKTMFRRQEVKDLIALCRAIADPRDTLSLGAFLRGPLVGITEAEMLAEVAPDGSEVRRRLRLGEKRAYSCAAIAEAMAHLDALAAAARTQEPFAVLTDAVQRFSVMPKLSARNPRTHERAVANVDRLLELSKAYGVRGLKAFADTAYSNWLNSEKEVEGRPDGEDDSVSIVTMHSAKGLEWPIVIPVNAVGRPTFRETVIVRDGVIHPCFAGHRTNGFKDASEAERADVEDERVRIWYVAATRARDFLVIPEVPDTATPTWATVVDLAYDSLPDVRELLAPGPHVGMGKETHGPVPDADEWRRERDRIAARPRIRTSHPSRQEHPRSLETGLSLDDVAEALPDDRPWLPFEEPAAVRETAAVRGGKGRGEVLHRLMEEVLTGETEATAASLASRAAEIEIQYRSREGLDAPACDPDEAAGTVLRALAVPQVAGLLGRLVPEYAAYGHGHAEDGGEMVEIGVADAVEEDGKGGVKTVVDWKSDVSPSEDVVEGYSDQVRDYMRLLGAPRGLIVFMTAGMAVEVTP